MNKKILDFCLERGILIDNELLNLFSETEDIEAIKELLDKIKPKINQRLITKNILINNKETFSEILRSLNSEGKNIEKLKIKLGLSIEISKESSEEDNKETLEQTNKSQNQEYYINEDSIKQLNNSITKNNQTNELKQPTNLSDNKEENKESFDSVNKSSEKLIETTELNENNFKENLEKNQNTKNYEETQYTQNNFNVIKTYSKEFENLNPGNVKIVSDIGVKDKKLEVSDFVKYFKARFSELRDALQQNPVLNNLVSINKISSNKRNLSIIGLVSDKRVTKNKNIILEVEDLTGKINLLVSKEKEDLYKKAEDITLDSVLGFKCAGNNEILFVNDIVFPETMLRERRKSNKEEYALFIGDLHFGSKKFLKNSFLRFIDYLNGNFGDKEEVKKIKYLFIVGDVVTGVGNYPNQEEDLEIKDLEEQFLQLSELLSKIRKDIKIIISPGNHDGVRLMEPQPLLDEKYAWPIHNLDNVILTTNPAVVNIAENEGFDGLNVLTYHGYSFPYYAGNISKLILKNAMNCPEEIMKYLLMYRHLAPTHGSSQYFPFEKDFYFIRDIPDIFVAAHTHKSAITYYNNILLISVSSWEGMTPYQEKFGNIPDHCKVPMLNLKTRAIKLLDFEEDE